MPTTARRRTRYTSFLAAMLALGLLVGWWMGQPRDAVPLDSVLTVDGYVSGAATVGSDPAAGVALTMTGGVSGLAPGTSRTLLVTLTNPGPGTYQVATLDAVPEDATPACRAAGTISVTGYRATTPGAPRYVVPGRSSITVPLAVTFAMSAANQDGCRNVTFPLRFTGTATAVQGSPS